MKSKQFNEQGSRTGLKFGYPDGYYRDHYPHYYMIPKSATGALDLEIEKTYSAAETSNGIPVSKGSIGFKEWLTNTKSPDH